MSDHTYKVIELIGTSSKSWEEAAANAVASASQSLKDLRIAEVTAQDLRVEDGKIVEYRTRLNVSFRFHGEHGK